MPLTSKILAVFGSETAMPPVGLSTSPIYSHHEITEEEIKCKAMLKDAFSRHPSSDLLFPGKGCGLGMIKSPYCSYASREGVHVMFSGEVSKWPGIDVVESAHDAFMSGTAPAEADDASWLLDFYTTFTNTDVSQAEDEILQEALQCLSVIEGTFAFVIYDSVFHRVLAARDSDGTQPLFWGATEDGQLMFGSVIEDLVACNPSATMFPPGTMFSSVRHSMAFNPGPTGWVIADPQEYPGDLCSFVKADEEHWKSVKAIPRITSKGCLAGAVYKVSSQPDFVHLMGQH